MLYKFKFIASGSDYVIWWFDKFEVWNIYAFNYFKQFYHVSTIALYADSNCTAENVTG